jgi:hypothetical protein
MLWRAARSCPGGWMYFYSIPVLLAELVMALMSNLFLLSLWRQVERPSRWLADMLPAEEIPAVDVYIVCYTGKRLRSTMAAVLLQRGYLYTAY